MNINLNDVNTLLEFLDTEGGKFWESAADMVEGRTIKLDFTITNAKGEQLETNAHQLAGVATLLATPVTLAPGMNNPVVVLNAIWNALRGVPLVGTIEEVSNYIIRLEKDKVLVTVNLKDDDQITGTAKSNLAVRIFVLKSFAEIDAGLESGMAAWPGVATITVDMNTGAIEIIGISPVVQEASPTEYVEPAELASAE